MGVGMEGLNANQWGFLVGQTGRPGGREERVTQQEGKPRTSPIGPSMTTP